MRQRLIYLMKVFMLTVVIFIAAKLVFMLVNYEGHAFGVSDVVAQQTDIMPTLLNLVGYPYPYIAFGIDLLSTSADDSWALHYNNGIYQFVRHNRALFFDGEQTVGYQSLIPDTLPPADNTNDLQLLKAIVQSYMQRMVDNRLVVE